jgi:hypothetical protein
VDDDELTEAICLLLQDAGVGVFTTTATGSQVQIVYGDVAAAGVDRAIGVTTYAAVTDDPQNGLTARRVQLRSRGAPGERRGANQLGGAGFRALHRTIRSRGVAFGVRVSFTPLGADGNRRQGRTDNYTITLDNPEA